LSIAVLFKSNFDLSRDRRIMVILVMWTRFIHSAMALVVGATEHRNECLGCMKARVSSVDEPYQF
jgi:TPP-dependent indolepyruvate ferredoxin oxidoreductase alpha subunit